MASPIELKISRYLNGDGISDTLNGSEITLLHDYNPMPGDGKNDITETIPVLLEGSQSTVVSTVNSINRYLGDAIARAGNGYGDRVYLNARGGTAGTWRRSEILDGRLSISDDGIRAGLSSNTRTPATLTVTRRGYFEDTTGAYLTLTNSNGTATGGTYLPIYGCLDYAGTAPAKRDNSVIALAANISGDLPSPVTTYIKQVTAGGTISKIYAGRFLSNNGTASAVPGDPNPVYFRQESSGAMTGGSAVADANCSGGSYRSSTLASGAEVLVGYGVVASTDENNQIGGAAYHIITRFRDTSSLANVKFRLKFISGTTPVWSGPQFKLSTPTDIIQDLGVMNLPPGLPSMFDGGMVGVYAVRTTASTETINLDFIEYFGSEFFKLVTLVPAAADTYIYGGENRISSRLSGANQYMDIVGYGAQSFTVIPNKSCGYFFLAQLAGGSAPITNNMSVMMRYRPRWSYPL